MDMTAYPRNIKDILALDRSYEIPRFQREYAWENAELNTIYNDILDQIEIKDGEFKISEYFIGSLVLIGDDTKDKNFIVVDGQQRITTITIILSVLAEKFLELEEKNLASSIHKYVVGTNDDGDNYYKLVNENPKPFLQLRIQDIEKETDREPSSDEEKKLLFAYNYFHKKLNETALKKVFSHVSGKGHLDILKAIRDQVLKFKTIYITVSDIDTAYTIFETLNAKGKDLSSLDLIKNKIFQILDDHSPIDPPLESWNEMRRLLFHGGRHHVNMSIFYRHFWISKYSRATESKLYEQFLKHIPNEKVRYKAFLNELKTSANWYRKIALPQAEDWTRNEEREIYDSLLALKSFDTRQVRSILLTLFEIRFDDDKLSEKYFKKCLKGLEHFHFIFTAITSSRASWLDGFYSKYSMKLRASKTKHEVHIVINEFLKDLEDKIPTFDVYQSYFKNLYWDNSYTKDKELIKYIFGKLEKHFLNNYETNVHISSIEHIASQGVVNQNNRNLGNLLPLEQKINSAIGNLLFRDKVKYYRESEYKTVKYFLSLFEEEENDQWSEELNERWLNKISEISYNKVWRIR